MAQPSDNKIKLSAKMDGIIGVSFLVAYMIYI